MVVIALSCHTVTRCADLLLFVSVSFEGQWQDGTKHGTGKMCYGVGRGEYDGEWANDQRSGLGVMTYHSGNVYTGGWAADVRHGSGKMLWVVANEEYSGNWSLGSMHGEGKWSQLIIRVWCLQTRLSNL